jgi:hypothetical protein
MESPILSLLQASFPKAKLQETPEANLPWTLQKDYTFFLLQGERPSLIAFAKNYRNGPELLKALSAFKNLGRPEALIFGLKSLGSADKAVLLAHQVPFVSEEGEVYLPNRTTRLFARKQNAPTSYNVFAQSLAEFYFFAPEGFYGIKAIQTNIPLEPSLLSLANRTLYNLGLLEKRGNATAAQYARIADRSAYLDRLYPLLVSPIKQSFFTLDPLPQDLGVGSEGSLAFYSDVLPQYQDFALSKKAFRKLASLTWLEESLLLPMESYQKVDVFLAGPYLLHDGHLNPLDVIAIYQKDPDERVQLALNQMKEKLRDGTFR